MKNVIKFVKIICAFSILSLSAFAYQLFAQEKTSSSTVASASVAAELTTTADGAKSVDSAKSVDGDATPSAEKVSYGANFSKVSVGQDILLSLSAGWMCLAPNYTSEIMDIPLFLDPSFRYGWQIGIGKFFSFDAFLDYDFTGLLYGGSYFLTWCEKCGSWAGDASLALNIMLLGTPYVIGLIPSLYYALSTLDLGFYFFYHPYHNDWFDAKIGLGLTNEPSTFFDYYGWSFFLLPYISTRAEANFFLGIFKISIWALFDWDFLATCSKDGWYDANSGKTTINFTKLEAGVSAGFFIDYTKTKARLDAKKAKKTEKKKE